MRNVKMAAKRGLCSGCGVCAGVAPCMLSMRLSSDGEWGPTASCCSDCGLCESVCPLRHQPAEEVLQAPLGPALASFVGFSQVDGERSRGSSGGMVTRVLQALVERNWVDGIIAVVPTGHQQPLFKPAVLRDRPAIAAAAGSKYYPVEFSQVLRELRRAEGRFALVGLPCVITGLRLAQQQLPWLRERLRFVLGLTCGHTVSARYTDFLAYRAGVDPGHLRHAEYRAKTGTDTAGDFIFQPVDADGRPGRRLGFLSSKWICALWSNRLLTPQACFRCVDTFAVQADASFMDAWLPEYVADPLGHSLVVVRNHELLSLLLEERENARVVADPIASERVLASQRAQASYKGVVALLLSTTRPAGLGALGLAVSAFRLWRCRCRAWWSRLLVRRGSAAGYEGLQCWLRWWVLCGYLRSTVVRLVPPRVRALKRSLVDAWQSRGKTQMPVPLSPGHSATIQDEESSPCDYS